MLRALCTLLTAAPLQAYMEDHLQNKNRLEKEWEALCAYQAEPSSSLAAQREENLAKNRCPAVLTCMYLRVATWVVVEAGVGTQSWPMETLLPCGRLPPPPRGKATSRLASIPTSAPLASS